MCRGGWLIRARTSMTEGSDPCRVGSPLTLARLTHHRVRTDPRLSLQASRSPSGRLPHSNCPREAMSVNQRSATLERRDETDGDAGAAATQLLPEDAGRDEEPVLEDLLVEEVSIDGMCGVY
jgi:mycofactocin precursor